MKPTEPPTAPPTIVDVWSFLDRSVVGAGKGVDKTGVVESRASDFELKEAVVEEPLVIDPSEPVVL